MTTTTAQPTAHATRTTDTPLPVAPSAADAIEERTTSVPPADRQASGPRAIVYDQETYQYRASYDGIYIDSFWTIHDADVALGDYERGLFEDGLIDAPPAIYARPADLVEEFIPGVVCDAPVGFPCPCELHGAHADDPNVATLAERTYEALTEARCQMNVLGTHWAICGAPSDGPCMCDVIISATPATPAGIVQAPTTWNGYTDPETGYDADDIRDIPPRVGLLETLFEDVQRWRESQDGRDLAYMLDTAETIESLATPAASADPIALVGAATPQPFTRAPQCDTADSDGWRHELIGHTFCVAVGHVPLACPICDACEPPRNPDADLRTMEMLMRATLEAWKCLEVRTSFDDELAALARQVERLSAPTPVCRECGGPHTAATCPRIALARNGMELWESYIEARLGFLKIIQWADAPRLFHMGEAVAYYLSTRWGHPVTADRVLGCWAREIGQLA